MPVEIREVRTGKEKRLFIYFPERLYEKRYPQWVHPIYKMQRSYFDPGKNDAWNHSDVVLYLAWRSGRPVGRIMALINHRLNKFRSTNEARFSYFDCINDQQVATALLNTAEKWARAKGISCIIGPLGFTNTDTQGILVEGQKHRSIIASWWHPPYTPSLIEEAGYRKEIDWVGYSIDLTENTIPAVYAKIAKRVLAHTRYELVEFKRHKELKAFIEPVFKLVNESYADLYGFSPLTDEEIKKTAANYFAFLDHRFAKIVTLNEEVVGFALGLPDLSRGFRAARGRLFPFGFTKILRARNRSKRLDMVLGAIKRGHRGKGLDALMANSMYRSAIDAGMTHIDTHKEQEKNTKVRGELERVGGKIYKRYRVYRKKL